MNNAARKPNHLAEESSPYLLQHRYNPVDWHPWNDEALTKALDENKLLVISIGYSACHWCHVMEHESFEDEEVAQLMNAHFVNIKVDREERPDVDAIYMDAVQALTGQGGWPLNVVCLPDGRPVWGGTYFQKAYWMHYLGQVSRLWEENPDRFRDQAEKLVDFMKKLDQLPAPPAERRKYTLEDVTRAYQPNAQRFDVEWGGFQGAPKFPTPVTWQFLMRYAHHSKDAAAQQAVENTLRRMAWGGIYDHVGGGFARYSVDDRWHVPHFEKMLYDNAQLISLYSEAYRWKPDELYRQVVAETVEFAARELMNSDGGFFSALDADSEGEEGKFYVWTAEEIDKVLGDDAKFLKAYYDVQPGEGNWEHGQNVLMRTRPEAEVAAELGVSVAALRGKVDLAKARLLTEREKRTRPGLDDKILTAWNGLMCKGLVDAYRTFGEKRYLDLAVRNAAFIQHHMKQDTNRLLRNFKDGKTTINAYLDDYAFTIEALIALYHATFHESYLQEACAYAEYVLDHFTDPASPLLFFTSDIDPPLITRKRELYDSVIPSSNSSLAHSLLTLGILHDHAPYRERAGRMLDVMEQHVDKYLSSFANWGSLMLRCVFPANEVAFTGPKAQEARLEFDRTHFHPNVLTMGAETSEARLPLLRGKLVPGQTLIYVCRERTCFRPVAEVNEAVSLLR